MQPVVRAALLKLSNSHKGDDDAFFGAIASHPNVNGGGVLGVSLSLQDGILAALGRAICEAEAAVKAKAKLQATRKKRRSTTARKKSKLTHE